jgi:UDP-glucuronate 4-epimerase
MRVLVTGGAGFIGSHLVDSLLSSGADVTVIDNFDPFYERAVKERNIRSHRIHARFRLVEADIRDLTELTTRLGPTGPYDAIVHLAAKVAVRPSIAHPSIYQDVNLLGTQNLLDLAHQLRVPQFVFASSSSVYGVNPRVPWSEDDYVLKPISPYASTKVSGELLGHVYSALHGIRFVALRFFTVYGPRQRPDLAIHKFARLMKEGRPIPLYGDGCTRRDYTYVDDVIAGVRAALTYQRSHYEVINLGNSTTVTLLDMIRELERGLGVSATIEWLPEQPGDVPQTWASVAKARELLAYEPCTPFAVGIRHFCDWFTGQSATLPGRGFFASDAAAGV